MSELKLSNTTGRLVQLEREVGLLRQNHLVVNRLTETADGVTDQAKLTAEEAQQVAHMHALIYSTVPWLIFGFWRAIFSSKTLAFVCVKEFDVEVKDRFEEVEDLVEDKGESVLQARSRADKLQQEARELLIQSGTKLQRLEGNKVLCLFCVFSV